jgi:high-affinity Fe2+/Pb2+ permease
MNWHKLIWIALAGALVLVQAALVAAKWTGRIHLSWLLTLTRLWLPIACVAVLVIVGIVMLSNASANGENPFQ